MSKKKSALILALSILVLIISALSNLVVAPILSTVWIIYLIIAFGMKQGLYFTLLMGINVVFIIIPMESMDASLQWIGVMTYMLMSIGIGLPIDLMKREQLSRKASEERLRRITDNIHDVIIQIDSTGIIRYISPSCFKLFGYESEYFLGRSLYEDVHPDDYNVLLSMVEGYKTSKNKSLKQTEYRYLHKQGEYIWIQSLGEVIPDVASGGSEFVISCRDITKRKQMEEALIESQYRWKFALEGSGDGIIDLNLITDEVYYSPHWVSMFGYNEEDIGCTREELLSRIHPLDYKKYEDNNPELFEREIPLNDMEYRIRCKDGSYKWILARGKVVKYNLKGDPIRVIGTFTDITEIKSAHEKVKYLSYHDTLTGLYNRAFFEEELKKLLAAEVVPLSVIIGDVNGLKLTNDVFGHYEGDMLLVKVAGIFKESCRTNDIVFRWGGDEFAVLLPDATESAALKIIDRINENCAEAINKPIRISIALGAATKYSVLDEMKDVLKEAEDKMYRHKLLESSSVRSNIISSLEKTLLERSHETNDHMNRLKHLALELGNKIGLSQTEQDELRLLAMLHDIGKIAVNDGILEKSNELTEDEWVEIKKHSEVGYRIAKSTPELYHIADYILHHHERWDGKGYPNGLSGEEIPRLSRILSIIDSFDVMTHVRPYKNAMSTSEAVEELKRHAGTQFDPNLIDAFIQMVSVTGWAPKIINY